MNRSCSPCGALLLLAAAALLLAGPASAGPPLAGYRTAGEAAIAASKLKKMVSPRPAETATAGDCLLQEIIAVPMIALACSGMGSTCAGTRAEPTHVDAASLRTLQHNAHELPQALKDRKKLFQDWAINNSRKYRPGTREVRPRQEGWLGGRLPAYLPGGPSDCPASHLAVCPVVDPKRFALAARGATPQPHALGHMHIADLQASCPCPAAVQQPLHQLEQQPECNDQLEP